MDVEEGGSSWWLIGRANIWLSKEGGSPWCFDDPWMESICRSAPVMAHIRCEEEVVARAVRERSRDEMRAG